MKLPLGFGSVEFQNWVRGLVSAIVGGGSNAVVAGVTVNALYPPESLWKLLTVMGAVFVASGLYGGFAYLAQHQLPELKTVTTTVEKTETGPPAKTTTVTTVEETHVEPIAPKDK